MNLREQEKGLTLTELMVVMTLAGMVTLGLVSFYFNAQSAWIDGSTQALAQREATLIAETITDRVHSAEKAEIFPSPDSLHEGITLTYPHDAGQWSFWWDSDRIYEGASPGVNGRPIGDTKVEAFELDRDLEMVYIRRLWLLSANGQHIQLSTTLALVNRPS